MRHEGGRRRGPRLVLVSRDQMISRHNSAIALLLVSLHFSTAGIVSGEAMGGAVCMPPPGAQRTAAMRSAGQATTVNAPLLLRLRGGSTAFFDATPASASLAGTGRVVDEWDVNSFHSSVDGDVIVFRHSVRFPVRSSAPPSSATPTRSGTSFPYLRWTSFPQLLWRDGNIMKTLWNVCRRSINENRLEHRACDKTSHLPPVLTI